MNKKYCSIDLEFTGFDPEKEQILEIGFAFFDVTDSGLRVGETWSQVFKPTIEVHQKILGLTGITQEEIDTAPSIGEFKDFLTEKLQGATLVAHNPTLDIKFLEMAGVKLSGEFIDTLELVQFILPTHHSYNLENLMHYFGIEHKDSHRALADCLSTISLLEKMVAIHNNFSDQLKSELAEFLDKGNFSWRQLLELKITHKDFESNDSLSRSELAEDELESLGEVITIDSKHHLHESRVAKTLQKEEGRWLLAMRSKQEVLKLWQAGLVEGVFETKDLFDAESFKQFKASAQTPEEYRFILKILVWLHTNWQTKTILDLNLSFFGGQFKTFICGGDYKASDARIIASDFRTLLVLAEDNLEPDRKLQICDLQRFEYFITHNSTERISWYSFNYVLKSIYNPETDLGQSKYKRDVIESLSSTDLFFGLVQITLRKNLKDLEYISMSDLEEKYGVFYNRLQQAASNLAAKLQSLSNAKGFEGVQKLTNDLNSFFKSEENLVKWIELSDENVVLHSQPIEIKEMAANLMSSFKAVRFTDTLVQKDLLFYLAERLGLDTEIVNNIKNYVRIDKEPIEFDLNNPREIFEQLGDSSFPVVVVFPGPNGAKSFYKDHFADLSGSYRLFAQEYSGSGNKIFRNFRIFPNALLLATSQFINKQRYSAPSGTVIYLTWPKTDEQHPYIRSLLANYSESYPELVKILNLNDFIFNLKQLSGHKLPRVLVSKELIS
ncbi:hypothetical protein IPM19_04530 [bacterium]|nr:MAG: hypothetical protein IPM19_04530 [bacterium]